MPQVKEIDALKLRPKRLRFNRKGEAKGIITIKTSAYGLEVAVEELKGRRKKPRRWEFLIDLYWLSGDDDTFFGPQVVFYNPNQPDGEPLAHVLVDEKYELAQYEDDIEKVGPR